MHTLTLLAPISSAALAAALISSIWQGTLLAVVVAVCLRLLPGLNSGARSAIWTAVLILAVVSPALILLVPHTHAAGAGTVHLRDSFSFDLVCLWAAIAAFRLTQLTGSALRLRGIVQRAEPVHPHGPVADLLAGSPRPATLCTSDEVNRPSVAGFFRPRILLPSTLLPELTEDELGQVILHELEHLRRRDDWTNLLQQLSLAVFPLNPVLVWLNRRLCQERELACDDSVLEKTRARKAYAACLARVAENSLLQRGLSLALGIFGDWKRRSELSERVDRILRSPAAMMGRSQRRLATGLLFGGVLAGAGVLARAPQLVSFVAPGAPAAAQAELLPGGATMLPVASRGLRGLNRMPLPHPTLVRAVMPAHAALPESRIAQLLRKPRQRPHTELHLLERRSAPARSSATVVLTSWQAPAWQIPAWQVPVWQAPPSAASLFPAAPHLVPVVFATSADAQTLYAAVPWQNGWLVVQL